MFVIAVQGVKTSGVAQPAEAGAPQPDADFEDRDQFSSKFLLGLTAPA